MHHEWLGRVAYAPTIERLERQRDRVLAGESDAQRLFLCEHDPVITLGRSANRANVLAGDVPVIPVRRGGDVTYHGPGQLMVYPVVRVRRVVAFLQAVAGALAGALAHYGIDGAGWRRDPAGVWLGDAKIAACGIHLRRGVSIHGFALDVSTPAQAWAKIVPCGLPGVRVTSMRQQLGDATPAVADVAAVAGPLIAAALSATSRR